jgi:hypothetical protein
MTTRIEEIEKRLSEATPFGDRCPECGFENHSFTPNYVCGLMNKHQELKANAPADLRFLLDVVKELKWEYENACGFANDYEIKRDQLRVENEQLRAVFERVKDLIK